MWWSLWCWRLVFIGLIHNSWLIRKEALFVLVSSHVTGSIYRWHSAKPGSYTESKPNPDLVIVERETTTSVFPRNMHFFTCAASAMLSDWTKLFLFTCAASVLPSGWTKLLLFTWDEFNVSINLADVTSFWRILCISWYFFPDKAFWFEAQLAASLNQRSATARGIGERSEISFQERLIGKPRPLYRHSKWVTALCADPSKEGFHMSHKTFKNALFMLKKRLSKTGTQFGSSSGKIPKKFAASREPTDTIYDDDNHVRDHASTIFDTATSIESVTKDHASSAASQLCERLI